MTLVDWPTVASSLSWLDTVSISWRRTLEVRVRELTDAPCRQFLYAFPGTIALKVVDESVSSRDYDDVSPQSNSYYAKDSAWISELELSTQGFKPLNHYLLFTASHSLEVIAEKGLCKELEPLGEQELKRILR